MVRQASPEATLDAYFESKGYQVGRASLYVDGASGFLEEIEVFEPDVILLQAGQPEFDGFELCRQLKANRQLSKITVILFGTENSLESIVKAYRAGVHSYVAFTGEEYFWLLNLIERLSGKSGQPGN